MRDEAKKAGIDYSNEFYAIENSEPLINKLARIVY